MIKKCKFCHTEKEMTGKQLFCNPKCKKNFENSQRNGGQKKNTQEKEKYSKSTQSLLLPVLNRPETLKGEAAEYWDRVSPILIQRGHLNAISQDIFIELCDLKQRLYDINLAITETNPSLLRIDDKGDNDNGGKIQVFKESALSDIKRKYSRLLLDYSKQFYLTPLSNRGNFDIPEDEDDPLDSFIKGQNGN
jgi:phage terminase small subunit